MRAIWLGLLLAACSSPSPQPAPSPYPGRLDPIAGQWTAYGAGTGVVTRLTNSFTIPTQASGKSLNYIYTAPLLGQTITLNYSIAGDAMFGTVDGGTPAIHLFIWQANDQGGTTYRWWCQAGNELVIGDNQTLACTISPMVGWSDVNGQPASTNAAAFNTAATNLYAVGFTFGGQFYGHGVWTTSGSATFTINSFTVQ